LVLGCTAHYLCKRSACFTKAAFGEGTRATDSAKGCHAFSAHGVELPTEKGGAGGTKKSKGQLRDISRMFPARLRRASEKGIAAGSGKNEKKSQDKARIPCARCCGGAGGRSKNKGQSQVIPRSLWAHSRILGSEEQ